MNDRRTVLVTGAAAGIRTSIATRSGEAGYRLALLDISRSGADAMVQQLRPRRRSIS